MSMREEPLIYEISRSGRVGCTLPLTDVPDVSLESVLPSVALREVLDLPELSELDVVRHFARLSERQVSLDASFYPLGSCTMKYNPRINERIARMPGFSAAHPLLSEDICQGALGLMYELQHYLAEIGGMDAVSLQPAAGAQGELGGCLIIKAYHQSRGDSGRTVLLVPESAHGTNPATASRAGFRVRKVPCNQNGTVDILALKALMAPDVAGIMLTNPNTLGIFETDICEIGRLSHEAGALMYGDGANLNAILGRARPGDMGFDVMHYNLHKTFSTPHGGGGPGAGPIGVKEFLAPFLPIPVIEQKGEAFWLNVDRPLSIGRLHSFYGNFLIMVRAYAYIRTLGNEGLREVSGSAVLNANYLLAKLGDTFPVPYGKRCMHEFVASASGQRALGVRALDIAKRLLDFGFHPPTVYFPSIVPEALMIEPTETESKSTLDAFADAMLEIDRETRMEPETVTGSPANMCVGRVDEVAAARQPKLRWTSE